MNAHRSAQVVKVVVDVDKVRCKKKIEREYRSGSAGGGFFLREVQATTPKRMRNGMRAMVTKPSCERSHGRAGDLIMSMGPLMTR
jgi:hypothetical protein